MRRSSLSCVIAAGWLLACSPAPGPASERAAGDASGGATAGASSGGGARSTVSGGAAGSTAGGSGVSGSSGTSGGTGGAAGGTGASGGAPGVDGGAVAVDADGLQQLLVTSAVGIGYYTACHILPDFSVKCFGDDHPRTRPPAIKTKQMTCAHDGCCALMAKENGSRIVCWSDKRTIFPPADVAKAVDPVQIGIGYQHGCALNVDHSVTCWGQNGTMNTAPAGLKAKSIAVAAYYNCAVTMDDSVVCWGINPPPPPAGLKARLVTVIFHGGGHLEEAAAATRHACAIQLDGTAVCWGDNIEGTTDVPADLGVIKDIAVATYNTCAVRPDGGLICWGTKRWNTEPARWNPRPEGLKLKGIRGKFASYCGLQLDDTLVCWGEEKTTHLTIPPGTKLYVP